MMSNTATRQTVDQFLQCGVVPLGAEFDCPYLPSRRARHRCFSAAELNPEVYHALLDRGFRRSGTMFYQPNCPDCNECRQLRLPVADFQPSKSQRRVKRLNADITVEIDRPCLTDQKHQIYRRYLEFQHDGTMSDSYQSLHSFLYSSPVDTLELEYRVGDRLIGVAIADRSADMLSSVYMYFEPACAARSLGTYSALWEIDYCRQAGIPYYYFGFYIKYCNKMSYKAKFQPCEVLDDAGQWVRYAEAGSVRKPKEPQTSVYAMLRTS